MSYRKRVSLENATGKAFWTQVILMASLIFKSSFANVSFTEKTGVLRKSAVERRYDHLKNKEVLYGDCRHGDRADIHP